MSKTVKTELKLNMNQLAPCLGVKTPALSQWLKDDPEIPHERKGNRVYFNAHTAIPYIIETRYTPNHKVRKLEKEATPTGDLELRQQLAKTITMEAKANATLNEYVPADLLQQALSNIFKTFANDLERLPARLKHLADTPESNNLLTAIKDDIRDMRENLFEQFNNIDVAEDVNEVFDEVEENWYGK